MMTLFMQTQITVTCMPMDQWPILKPVGMLLRPKKMSLLNVMVPLADRSRSGTNSAFDRSMTKTRASLLLRLMFGTNFSLNFV